MEQKLKVMDLLKAAALNNMNEFIDFISPIFTQHHFSKKGKVKFINKSVNCERIFELEVVDRNRFSFSYSISFNKFDLLYKEIFFPNINFLIPTLEIHSFSKFSKSNTDPLRGRYILNLIDDQDNDSLIYNPEEVKDTYNEIKYIFEKYCLSFYNKHSNLIDVHKTITSIDVFSDFRRDYSLTLTDIICKDLLLTLIFNPNNYNDRKRYYLDKVGKQPPIDSEDLKTVRYDKVWENSLIKIKNLESFNLSPYLNKLPVV